MLAWKVLLWSIISVLKTGNVDLSGDSPCFIISKVETPATSGSVVEVARVVWPLSRLVWIPTILKPSFNHLETGRNHYYSMRFHKTDLWLY